ncbi:MAG TPA: DNA polymerase Y family protein [Verrucomicrobiae bacterium]|jgi:protein ImuB|nr:DNA polymerase Y family protein [Verrucomicrobiae bacterium]
MFACLFAPDFPVQAALRLEPGPARAALQQSPVVILEGPASLLRVFAANENARQAGIEIGMTRLQVEACSRATLRKRSPAQEDAAQSALLDCARAFSPRVESTAPGTVVLDLTGTEKLFGLPQNAAAKIFLLAGEFGFDLNIAIAPNPDTALYTARGFAGVTIIPSGEEAKRLGPLLVAVLSPPLEVLEILECWGIRNLQSLGALPPVALVERLGQSGLHLQRLARGEIHRPLVPAAPATDFIESFEFDDPVETLESLVFILNRLLHQLCARLACRSLATNELRLKLELASWQKMAGRQDESYDRLWKLPFPMQDAKVLFRLAYLDLEDNTQSSPVKKLIVQVVPVKPRLSQSGLFAPPSPEAEQLEITLARVRGVTGAADQNGIACAGSPQVLDSHKPDSFSVRPFSTVTTKDADHSAPVPVLALRMFRPVLETSVETMDQKPRAVSLRKKRLRVLAASGPWRSSGHWWNAASAWKREEWDVALQTADGVGFYRIYLDRLRKQWFVEGVLD